MKRVTIGGVGNILMGDDGVGPYVVHTLDSLYEFPENVEVADLGTPGLDLVAHMAGNDVLILVDCVNNSSQPGTVTLYRKEDLKLNAPTVRLDPHSPALTESILIADMAGDGPKELLLVGISGSCFETTTELTTPVRHAVDAAIAEILNELNLHGIEYCVRATPLARHVFWEPLLAQA